MSRPSENVHTVIHTTSPLDGQPLPTHTVPLTQAHTRTSETQRVPLAPSPTRAHTVGGSHAGGAVCSGAAESAAASAVPGPLACAGAITRTRQRYSCAAPDTADANEGGPGLPYSPNGRPGNANRRVPPIPSPGRGTRLTACCQQQQWFTPRQLRCRRRRICCWAHATSRASTGAAEWLRQFRRQGWQCRRRGGPWRGSCRAWQAADTRPARGVHCAAADATPSVALQPRRVLDAAVPAPALHTPPSGFGHHRCHHPLLHVPRWPVPRTQTAGGARLRRVTQAPRRLARRRR